jgi:hypothetical protein
VPVEAFDPDPVVYIVAESDDVHLLWSNGHQPSAWLKIFQVQPEGQSRCRHFSLDPMGIAVEEYGNL